MQFYLSSFCFSYSLAYLKQFSFQFIVFSFQLLISSSLCFRNFTETIKHFLLSKSFFISCSVPSSKACSPYTSGVHVFPAILAWAVLVNMPHVRTRGVFTASCCLPARLGALIEFPHGTSSCCQIFYQWHSPLWTKFLESQKTFSQCGSLSLGRNFLSLLCTEKCMRTFTHTGYSLFNKCYPVLSGVLGTIVKPFAFI